eukprot:3761750-Alexandrium_andersonii.AAC.1
MGGHVLPRSPAMPIAWDEVSSGSEAAAAAVPELVAAEPEPDQLVAELSSSASHALLSDRAAPAALAEQHQPELP